MRTRRGGTTRSEAKTASTNHTPLVNRRALFEALRDRTGMFVRPRTYACVASFVLGYDMALDGGMFPRAEQPGPTRVTYALEITPPS